MKVSVIITTHLMNNKVYLDACMKSVYNQTHKDIEVFVMSSAESPPTVPPGFIPHWNMELNNSAKKTKYAIDNLCAKDTFAYLWLADDTVLSQSYIESMVEAASLDDMILTGYGNQENNQKFYTPMPMRTDIDYDEGLANWTMAQPKDKMFLIPQDWISFYAVFVKRSVYEKVGPTDQILVVRGDDLDYCKRAHDIGIPTYINTASLVLHWGSKTLPFCENSHEDRLNAEAHIRKKYNID